jgi:hypothetical protein
MGREMEAMSALPPNNGHSVPLLVIGGETSCRAEGAGNGTAEDEDPPPKT